MEIAGYLAAILIGLSLGLIGGGGSILTVPVMVYLMGTTTVMATSYSLFVVGITSTIGAIQCKKRDAVSLKTAVIFGIPALVSVYATRRWLIPAIPENFFELGGILITKDLFLLLLFAILMVVAAFSMILDKRPALQGEEQQFNYPLILIEGLIVGVLTGLVGAGGGFLIIPALVILSRLPMKLAVGTSLAIIAAKSLAGFVGDLNNLEMDWQMLSIFTALSIVGIFLGGYLSTFIEGKKLKPIFGWFTLIMGAYIIVKEIFLT